MGFLNETTKGPSYYLEITNEGKLVRPLVKKPMSLWFHRIHEVKRQGTNGQTVTIRKFQLEPCTSVGKGGSGCKLCNMQDPLWSMLEPREQTNKNGKRADFPKTPIHFMPVYNHAANDVFVVKGGNGTYKDLDIWYDAQQDHLKDLSRCDWSFSKSGVGKLTQYKCVRMDATPFVVSDDVQSKVDSIMKKVVSDQVASPLEKLTVMIHGESDDSNTAVDTVVPPVVKEVAVHNALQVSDTSGHAQVGDTYTKTSGYVQAQPKEEQKPVYAPPGHVADSDTLSKFSVWLSEQKELQGMGVINVLVPTIKEKFSHVEYNKLSSAQLNELRDALQSKLNLLRQR